MGKRGLVRIADDPRAFAAQAIDVAALAEDAERRLRVFDAFLERTSWDRTWQRMRALIEEAIVTREMQRNTLPHAQPRAKSA